MESKELVEYEKKLTRKPTPFEWYSESLPALRSIIQAIPGVGSSLDTLFAAPGQFIASKRIEQLFSLLGKALQHVDRSSIKLDWISSDEFHDILMLAIESSERTRSETKLRMNALILCNVLTVSNLGTYRPEEYLAALADMTPTEVNALLVFYDSMSALPPGGNDLETSSQVDWRSHMQTKCGIDSDDLHFFMKRLERTGFVSEVTGTFVGYTGGQFTVTTSLKRFIAYLAQNPDYAELHKNVSHDE